MRLFRRRKASFLDQEVLRWSQNDVLTRRGILESCLVLGRSGSGKTSGSGRALGQALLNDRCSGGLILAAQPGDAAMWRVMARKAGRELLVFSADESLRFNFIQGLDDGNPVNLVRALLAVDETLRRGSGRGTENGAFWESSKERFLLMAVVMLMSAREPVGGKQLNAFINEAAKTPAELDSPGWQQTYHARVLDKAEKIPRNPIQEHDYRESLRFWKDEFPAMEGRTRSNILAETMLPISVFNQGIVREMLGTTTNVSPKDVLDGRWLLVDFPPCMGAASLFITVALKYAVQTAILRRKAEEDCPYVVIWGDEYSQTVNRPDVDFLCMSRGHKGCSVNLLQSVASLYAAFPGEQGRHYAEALMGNYAHSIIHPSDAVTAHWASQKLGRRRETFISGGFHPKPDATLYDDLFGTSCFHGSFSEHYENVLQENVFLTGRTGSPVNDYYCDSVIIKSGTPFADGNNYLFKAWRQ